MSDDTRPHVIVRPMALEDIDQVVIIDRLSFPNPWPPRTYRYEVGNNNRSRMFVLEPYGANAGHNPNGRQQMGWLERLLVGEQEESAPPSSLIGYSGLWNVADETHISTIAVHPDWRGLKLGELLLWMMLRHAIRQKARIVTLEVRISNEIAQNLYCKYGFEIVGRRRGYYSDNHEDAYNMGITPLDAAYRARLIEFGKQLARHVRVTDRG
jgi:ribosomal-protein-alanine N-acetyltransferase